MEESLPQLPRSRAAMERLERALQRLEQVSVQPKADLFSVPAAPKTPQVSLDAEHLARIDSAIDMVEQRLEDVIGRLEHLVEGMKE